MIKSNAQELIEIESDNNKTNNAPTFILNSTDFSKKVETYLNSLKYNSKEEYLQYHQFIINKYLIHSQLRGLLLYHEMGYGKSILAVSIAENYRISDPERTIIFLMPKSLHGNMKSALKQYMIVAPNSTNDIESEDSIDGIINEHYNFISLNASNMYTQFSNLDKTKEELEFEKSFELINERLDSTSLENSLIIIDEYHNLSNSITNGSYNALKFYNKIIETRNIKLLFLTGTPIINHPFELVCTFNMLRGYRDKYLVFPEYMDVFKKFFIDSEKHTIKNKNKFQNRIMGLVSYYGTKYFNEDRPNFPFELPLKIERVPMSRVQFLKYSAMREIEKKEESSRFKKPGSDGQFKAKSEVQSSYRIRSRQVSNFLIPDIALTERGNKAPLKHINKIPKSVYDNLEKYSPKFARIIDNIKKNPKELSLVYSQFVSAEGLNIFAKTLEFYNYELWQLKDDDDDDEMHLKNDDTLHSDSNLDDDLILDKLVEHTGGVAKLNNNLKNKIKSKKLKYAIISGEVLPSERDRIKKSFNSKENIYGEIISVLLISESGART